MFAKDAGVKEADEDWCMAENESRTSCCFEGARVLDNDDEEEDFPPAFMLFFLDFDCAVLSSGASSALEEDEEERGWGGEVELAVFCACCGEIESSVKGALVLSFGREAVLKLNPNILRRSRM